MGQASVRWGESAACCSQFTETELVELGEYIGLSPQTDASFLSLPTDVYSNSQPQFWSHFSQATRHPFYLRAGAEMISAIEKHARVACGYATIHDVRDKSLEDRMESFFLSETAKYLYLVRNLENFESRPCPIGNEC